MTLSFPRIKTELPGKKAKKIIAREFTRNYNILLVVDEIQSGMGRTGKFLAIENYNVEPDIVLLAKGSASGLPLGAVISKKKFMPSEQVDVAVDIFSEVLEEIKGG